jgi:hypothetical protein
MPYQLAKPGDVIGHRRHALSVVRRCANVKSRFSEVRRQQGLHCQT